MEVHHDVFICQKCATETLPMLLADAVAPEHGRNVRGTCEAVLREFERHFWRAVLTAVQGRLDERGKCNNDADGAGGSDEIPAIDTGALDIRSNAPE